MRLTPEGEALERYCQRALELEGLTMSILLGKGASSEVRFKIVGPSSIMNARVIPASITVSKQYPQLSLDFEMNDQPQLVQQLKMNRSQLAISQKEQSQNLGKRVPRDKELSEQQKSIYYSSWIFTGIRNLSATAISNHADEMAERLNIEPKVAHRVIKFLLENGLCKEVDGKITYGPAAIHIDNESLFVNKHHQNWRLQAIQQMERKRADDLFFTSPMSLSREAFEEIKILIPAVIENIMKIAGPSDSETVGCLNLDWFRY